MSGRRVGYRGIDVGFAPAQADRQDDKCQYLVHNSLTSNNSP